VHLRFRRRRKKRECRSPTVALPRSKPAHRFASSSGDHRVKQDRDVGIIVGRARSRAHARLPSARRERRGPATAAGQAPGVCLTKVSENDGTAGSLKVSSNAGSIPMSCESHQR
jgi:hypothetical protein